MLLIFRASFRTTSFSWQSKQTRVLSCSLKTSCLRHARLMSSNITVTFLGTTSGGGPTETRNCSSLVVDPLGDGTLWMVDCAEGTVRQFAQQPYVAPPGRKLRLSQVSKIFITHMHADHTMGLLTVLRNALGIPKPRSAILPDTPLPNEGRPHVEIFGPRGVRRMLRSLWHLTHTHSEHAFVVHELLFSGQQPSVAADSDVPDGEGADEADVRRESECVGRDIWCDDQGFWRGIITQPASRHGWGALLDAGPIEHRDPCIGYIIREVPYALTPTGPLPRKLVILGDTYDPSPLVPLIFSDPLVTAGLPELNNYLQLDPAVVGRVHVPVSLLVHEATDACMPPSIDPYERTGRNRTEESVTEKTRERGHSTPAMAGAFARQIGAERLVLNHIGARCVVVPLPFTHICLGLTLWVSCIAFQHHKCLRGMADRSGSAPCACASSSARRRRHGSRCGTGTHTPRRRGTSSRSLSRPTVRAARRREVRPTMLSSWTTATKWTRLLLARPRRTHTR
ncbi:beta-lactamase-like protein [Lenzites betulinus]|nr:beta-lactamase-like protein [Lenzites betulinus]